jgi:hypothetical protein
MLRLLDHCVSACCDQCGRNIHFSLPEGELQDVELARWAVEALSQWGWVDDDAGDICGPCNALNNLRRSGPPADPQTN